MSSFYPTIATHVFIAIAAMCFALLFLIIPGTTKLSPGNKLSQKLGPYVLIILTILVYCIIVPSIMINADTLNTGSNFELTKLLSVVITVIIMYFFMIKYGPLLDSQRPRIFGHDSMSLIITTLFIVIISEDIINQWMKSSTINLNGQLNMANAFAGLLLVLSLIYNHRSMSIWSGVSNMKLISGLSKYFIAAYIFWALSTKINDFEYTYVPIYTAIALILPVYLMYNGSCDWLQSHLLGTLLFIILIYGIGQGSSNIFPWYGDSVGAMIQFEFLNTEWLRILLIVLSFLFGLLSLKK